MKKNLLKYYIAAFYLFSAFVAFAQPGSNDTGGDLEGGDNPAPIDDYVWFLAALGFVYVFLRLRAFAQQVKTSQE